MKGPSDSSLTHPDPEKRDFIGKAKNAFENGRIDEAIRIYEDAISRGHESGSIYETLGEMYLSLNEHEKALKWLQKAQEFKPDSAQLLERIVTALISLGRFAEACAQVNASLCSYPEMQIADDSLTNAVIHLGSSNDGDLSAISESVQADPSLSDGAISIADVLFRTKQYGAARDWYKIIAKHTHDALTFAKLACASRFAGHLSDAIRYQEKAVERDPDNAEYLANLGTLLMSIGQTDRGIEMLREAVTKAPEQARIHSSLLANLHYLPDTDPQMLFCEHKRWGQIHAPIELAATSHANDPDPNRRLRVGYLSADFRVHSVAYNFEAFLQGRNSEQVEVYGYGNIAVPDAMTKRLKQQFDHYRNIYGVDDKQVVRLIEEDKIDVLVAVGGHTSNNRLGVLAYKPAPIQVDYGGFNTSGMRQIAYRLTDDILDPAELREFYVEETVCLPGGLFCYNAPEFAPAIGPLPARQNGWITFGSFSNSIKINSYTLSLWAEVLKATRSSRLLLKFRGGNDEQVQNRYFDQFEQVGVSKERITICGRKSPIEHLELYNQVDIALDTFPVHGCLTTLEGLWMGVPVISLVGKNSLLSRTSLSILSRVGLEFFAASTPEEYVARATVLASKLDALARMRESMRERMTASTLCHAKYFAGSLEQAYRKMWHKWCQSGARKPLPSSQTASDFSDDDVLEFFISKNSPLQFIVSKKGLPTALLQAATAVNTGQIQVAAALINDEVVKTIRQMISDDPPRADAAFLLAALFSKMGQSQKAEEWYKEILGHQPHPLVFFELASICRNTGRLSEAVQYQEKAIELSPDAHELRTTLAEYLIRMGQVRKGMDMMQDAVEQTPDKVNHSKFLWHLHQSGQFDQQSLFEEHKRWGRIHAPAHLARTSHGNVPEPERKLRIGYISPDFCGHSVSYFFEPLADAHNREAVEVFGYANVHAPDEVTERLKPKFDCYRNIFGLKDKAVVGMIEQDKIDILVDLAGHTSDNRLGVMAHKPAPIQVTYLGFPDTTGLPQIDYRLTDELADPSESQKFHTEQLVFLPDGFLCYSPPGFAPPVTPLPVLEKGYITFGSFNNNCKIQPHIMDIWAQILKAKENSRLMLKFGGGDDPAIQDFYLGQFTRLGISPDRVQVIGRKPTVEHLKLYGQMDIALDTYPYNGTTTTCEAMWMGVPTVSLVGKAHASRVGLSILSRMGMEIFAASTPSEYVAKAVSFAGEIDNLAKIRASLRAMMFNSPLCDKKGFTRSLEDAYRKMWRQWCASGKAAKACVSIEGKPLCTSASAQPRLESLEAG